MPNNFLSVKAISEKFSVTRSTIYRWLQDPQMGFPKPIKIGHSTRWDEAEINSWVEAQKVKARGEQCN